MGIPTRQIAYLFISLILLLHLHASLPEWETLPITVVQHVHRLKIHRLKLPWVGGKSPSSDWDPEKIWDYIHPLRTLVWYPCYPGTSTYFECARLLVPLDYSSPINSTNRAAIALIRIPSPHRHSKRKESYKGPILFNPGGPGGSGVDFIHFAGGAFREILGDEFDLVGFDPRGISRSRPFVSFFNSLFDRVVHYSRQSAFGTINASTNSIAELVAGSRLVNLLGEKSNVDGGLKFINTDHTARDMLAIVNAYGGGEELKLQYWGFSYGSVLGATFATLFPDKVGRIVIDGVVDAEDYYSTSWTTNLIDTDKALQSFFDTCYEAGPSNCPFYAPSPSAISQNLTKIYERLSSNPLPFNFSPMGSYAVVDYGLVREIIFASLYAPYAMFPMLAEVLARLSRDDPPFIEDVEKKIHGFGNGRLDILDRVGEAQVAIVCNDGEQIPGTVQDTKAHFERLKKVSSFAETWTRIRTICAGWPDYPKFSPGPLAANTSHPILLIGNTADPVTPLWAAKKMSKAFPGSVVLTQDSPGHCSISGPSICTMKHVRAYFGDGKLPEEGTVCPVLGSPIPAQSARLATFGAAGMDGQVPFGELSEEDMTLAGAVVTLSETYSLPRL